MGDSVTDCFRRDSQAPLGNGYAKLFRDLLTIREPQKKVNILNKGTGGHKASDLRDRWEDDVLRNKPDWLSVMVGLNDICHPIWGMTSLVTPKMYEEYYDECLSQTKRKLPRTQILLLDPFFISQETESKSFRKTVLDLLPGFIRVVHKLARKYQTRHVKTHEIFQNLLKYHESERFGPEPIHPFPAGHLVLAEAVYDAVSK